MDVLLKVIKTKNGYDITTCGELNDLINALAATTIQVESSLKNPRLQQAFRIDYLKQLNHLRNKGVFNEK